MDRCRDRSHRERSAKSDADIERDCRKGCGDGVDPAAPQIAADHRTHELALFESELGQARCRQRLRDFSGRFLQAIGARRRERQANHELAVGRGAVALHDRITRQSGNRHSHTLLGHSFLRKFHDHQRAASEVDSKGTPLVRTVAIPAPMMMSDRTTARQRQRVKLRRVLANS